MKGNSSSFHTYNWFTLTQESKSESLLSYLIYRNIEPKPVSWVATKKGDCLQDLKIGPMNHKVNNLSTEPAWKHWLRTYYLNLWWVTHFIEILSIGAWAGKLSSDKKGDSLHA